MNKRRRRGQARSADEKVHLLEEDAVQICWSLFGVYYLLADEHRMRRTAEFAGVKHGIRTVEVCRLYRIAEIS